MGKNRRISSTPLYQCALGSPLICEAWRGRVWQTPKWGKASLQKSCKHQNEEKRFCRNAASLSRNFLAFAGAPQVPRETFWRLRESRKSLEKLFGLCGSPASLSENFLAFAGAPQTLTLIQYEEWECSLSTVHAKK